jgi:hypothetical protein
MYPDHQHPAPALDGTEAVPLLPRRTLLRRSLLGLTAAGLAPLLAACGGDDDEPDDEDTSDSPSGTDLDNAASTRPAENQQVGEDEEAEEAED